MGIGFAGAEDSDRLSADHGHFGDRAARRCHHLHQLFLVGDNAA